jgi:hypothetical protein
MDNLFDILRTAQNGQAIDNLARQFELSRNQAQAAVEALLPAFSLGLKRQVENARREVPPPNFFGLAGLPQIDAFQNAALAFTQQATQQGNQVIAALFGSNEMTKALARQAALQSGVGVPVLTAMLPALASILVSGLVHATLPHAQSGFGHAMSPNPAGDMLLGMMRAFHPPAAPPPPESDLLTALWAPFLEGPAAKPRQPDAAGPGDLFNSMLEAGSHLHEAQSEAMQSLFESWFGRK